MSKRQLKRIWTGTLLVLVVLAISSGCTTPAAEANTPESLPIEVPTATATMIPLDETETESAQSGPVILNIWLPPQFDPTNNTRAGDLLSARLEEFTTRRSDVTIQLRIKDIHGAGGIVDTLGTANAAAPLALPDLVVLDQPALQTAAAKGLLHPFDGLTNVMEDPDWFEFARQLSHVQNSTLGIPFAGDAQIMLYRNTIITEPPTDWAASFLLESAISYPAADPQSLLVMTLYQAAGGSIIDEEGAPQLEIMPLTDLFNFAYQANQIEVLPFWLTQYETDDQAWAAYEEGQADLSITWLSRYLQTEPQDSSLANIPTPDGIPYTTATGWVWSLISPDPERQTLVAELVEFLTNSEFLAEWSPVVGYLPPRPNALANWGEADYFYTLNQVGTAAHLAPATNIIETLGPVLNDSIVDVLKEQTDPATAAQNAIDALAAP